MASGINSLRYNRRLSSSPRESSVRLSSRLANDPVNLIIPCTERSIPCTNVAHTCCPRAELVSLIASPNFHCASAASLVLRIYGVKAAAAKPITVIKAPIGLAAIRAVNFTKAPVRTEKPPTTAASIPGILPIINNRGPIAAVTPATIVIIFFIVGERSLNHVASSETPLATDCTAGANTSPNAIPAPSRADFIRNNAPCMVLSIISAISPAAPLELSKVVVSFCNDVLFSDMTIAEATALLSKYSRAFPALSVEELIAAKASDIVNPSAVALSIIFLNIVPAVEASIPLLIITPSMAVVSCKDNPNAFATGATELMETWNFIRSKAEDENDLAITSVTIIISSACKPNALNVEPATVADVAKSSPEARARSRVASVIFVISSGMKPSLE